MVVHVTPDVETAWRGRRSWGGVSFGEARRAGRVAGGVGAGQLGAGLSAAELEALGITQARWTAMTPEQRLAWIREHSANSTDAAAMLQSVVRGGWDTLNQYLSGEHRGHVAEVSAQRDTDVARIQADRDVELAQIAAHARELLSDTVAGGGAAGASLASLTTLLQGLVGQAGGAAGAAAAQAAGLSTGTTVAIAGGGVVLLGLVGVVIYLLTRRPELRSNPYCDCPYCQSTRG